MTYTRGEDVKIEGARSHYNRYSVHDYEAISMGSSRRSQVDSRSNLNYGQPRAESKERKGMMAIKETEAQREEGSMETIELLTARHPQNNLSPNRLYTAPGQEDQIKEMFKTQPQLMTINSASSTNFVHL